MDKVAVTKGRSAEFAAQIVDWARGKGKILIVAHDNPDPDSLAAAYALRHLFLVQNGQEATITFGGIIGRGENRVMVRELEINYVPMEEVDLDEYKVVCLVDTQPGTGNNSYPEDRPVHIVIDHHPMREQTQPIRWVDVREGYGASATILFEYLLERGVYLGTKLATILFYAIKSETQDLGREWSQADREAYLSLVPLCNNRILYKITHPKVPQTYFASHSRAICNARLYPGGVLVFNLFEIDNPDIVAEMADFLLRMEDISLVLGLGKYKSCGILSLRTMDEKIAAGEVMRQVVGSLGTAGGHAMIAGGQVRPLNGGITAQRELEQNLTGRLQDALGLKREKGRRLFSKCG